MILFGKIKRLYIALYMESLDKTQIKFDVVVTTGHVGFIPGLGRSPGGEYGNPLQYSCLENPIDRGTW